MLRLFQRLLRSFQGSFHFSRSKSDQEPKTDQDPRAIVPMPTKPAFRAPSARAEARGPQDRPAPSRAPARAYPLPVAAEVTRRADLPFRLRPSPFAIPKTPASSRSSATHPKERRFATAVGDCQSPLLAPHRATRLYKSSSGLVTSPRIARASCVSISVVRTSARHPPLLNPAGCAPPPPRA